MNRMSLTTGLVAATAAAALAPAQPVIMATGQLFVPGDPDLPSTDHGHYDSYENYVYEIDVDTGVATAVSPVVTTDVPSALAGTPSGELFGFASGFASGSEFGRLVRVDPVSGVQTDIGPDVGLRSSALDITADGRGFILPFDPDSNTQQLHAIDLTTGSATPIGSATAIGDAIDVARGTPLGSAEPFIISLGSVGDLLFGVELDSESLVSIDSETGAVSVVGAIGAVGTANGGGYSGFSALTGVDEDLDGDLDALFGSVNQFSGGAGGERLGGIARFDLTTGAWTLVGTNPGIVFFGFGASAGQTAGCNASDLAEPFGVLDLSDVQAFIQGFTGQSNAADLAEPLGVWDLNDIQAFVSAFDAGCP